jgi:hypothetical protein
MEKGEEGGLVNILEEKNLLPSQQYGFRKNKYTTDVLTILENNIAEAIKKRQSTAMVSLEISKAYDMCWRYNILKKSKIGIEILFIRPKFLFQSLIFFFTS